MWKTPLESCFCKEQKCYIYIMNILYKIGVNFFIVINTYLGKILIRIQKLSMLLSYQIYPIFGRQNLHNVQGQVPLPSQFFIFFIWVFILRWQFSPKKQCPVTNLKFSFYGLHVLWNFLNSKCFHENGINDA